MPKIVDPEAKRGEFIAASWRVIAAGGLEGATLKLVAEEAGCTTGALTHYFPDRDSLLVAALRSAHHAAGERMVAASATAVSARERLIGVLEEALPLDEARLREWRLWLAFWAAAAGAPPLARENARRYAEWRALLESVLAPLTKSSAETRADAAMLMALIDGMGLRIAVTDEAEVALARRQARAQLALYLGRLGKTFA